MPLLPDSLGYSLMRRIGPWRALKGPNGTTPGPPPRLRSGGNLWQLSRQGLLDAYSTWAEESNWSSFIAWAGVRPHLVLTEPNLVREVVMGADRFVRNAEPTEALFGNGILRLDGPEWKTRRAALSGAFRAVELSRGVPIIREEIASLIDGWRAAPGGTVAPARDLSFAMFRILGRLLFGVGFDRQKHGGRPLRRSLITLSTGTVLRHLFPIAVVKTLTARQTTEARRVLDGLATEVLEGPHEKTPFRLALDAARARGEIDTATIIDELRTFIAAGQDTSATALGWTLAMLATHPEVQRRVREEVLGAKSLESMKDFNELAYTNQVIRESMRLFPPVPVSSYRAREDVTLGQWHLPRGTTIDICSYLLHRNPRLWPEPAKFDPERFASGNEVPQHAYLPFLFGPHTCIGMRLAMMEIQIAIAALVSEFELGAPDGMPRANLRLSLHPHGFRLQLRPLAAVAPSH